jgi:hypothetical protein
MLTNMSTRAYAAFILMVFTITFLVTCFLMAGSAGATASTTPGGPSVDRSTAVAPAWAWRKNWEPCTNDEPQATRCVWHAPTMGNGTGYSYLQTSKGVVIYIKHFHARMLLAPTYAA